MRYLVYLLTLFFIGTAIAQSPTIVQGDYITNVFGPSNFVKNPNAQINTANVTVSNATVTRGTTTPLVAKSEFTITTSTATGYAEWDLRAFDAGMKNNNCEARFTYRGFTVGSTKAQILQGANVVAELTLVGDANNPKQASINFPCGDLSAVTKFRLQQASAALTGTNEIGGIYTGLATNMANVAQAETVMIARRTTDQSIPNNTSTTILWNVEDKDVLDEYNSSTGVFTAKRAGTYFITSQTLLKQLSGWAAGETHELSIVKNTSSTVAENRWEIEVAPSGSPFLWNQVSAQVDLAVGDTIQLKMFQNNGATVDILGGGQYNRLQISRFPSSSELVVTPERQNVFGGVIYTAENQTLFGGTAAPTAYSSYNNATWNKPAKLVGKAQVTTTNSGNDLGFSIPNMPVGSYKVEISGLLNANNSGSTQTPSITRCNFRVVETDSSGTLRTEIARQVHQDLSVISATTDETRDYINSFFGVYNNTSVTTRNFRLEAQKFGDDTTGSIGGCQAYSGTGTNSYNTNITLLVTPLDQPSNSALYVQGPVLGAQTGAAIPEGYVNEFATRSITDTSIRLQLNPVTSTIYYPWTGTLSLPAGNWLLCYKANLQYAQTPSLNNIGFMYVHIQNQTDSIEVMKQAAQGQLGSAPGPSWYLEYLWSPVSQCKPIAITNTKSFRMGVSAASNTGSPVHTNVGFRGDLAPTELYAIRLN